MVDNELDAVELADVVSQGLVFTSGVNHHRDAMLAGRGQDPLVSALTHNFEIETGSDADTDSARRVAHLGHQIVDFRIVGVEARYIGESPWEARHRLFTERIFKAHDSIGQF